ncbi:MAG: dTDP-4-dehydrorhamnose 3,5-epimerase-like enzyme [Acidimicrobiales bacterium]|nr:dTDP-4-dehydrorhamnose 3,5-epimerase-like enzyme [Acidimicrobiales bacterium]
MASIDGVVVTHPQFHGDDRGRFAETYRRSWFPIGREMVQANVSEKEAGAVVGIHFHLHQADYWFVPRGRARVVLVDLRTGSPTEGAIDTFDMGDAAEVGAFIPPGVGHGFAALTDLTITYLVDQYYNPADENGVAWDDPDLGIDWGVADAVVSPRDQANPRVRDIPPDRRPIFALRT